MDIKNEEALKECLNNLSMEICGYEITFFDGNSLNDVFTSKRCMFSLLQLACSAKGITMPFANNHKLFYDDPLCINYINQTLDIHDVVHFLYLVLVEDTDYIKKNYSNIFSYKQFRAKVRAEEPIHILSSKGNVIASYLFNLYYTRIDLVNSFYFYYFLFGLEVINLLLNRNKSIDFSKPLDENYSNMLCSMSLFLPFERKVTMHYFVYSYLMSDAQRRINNYAFESAIRMKYGKFDFSDLVLVLYQGGKELNHDLKKQFENFFTKAYQIVNLDFRSKNEVLDFQDIILFIIWKMLYRDNRKNGNNTKVEYSDDYLNFNKIIQGSFNFLKLFDIEDLDKVDDDYTLCEPMRRNDYNVFYTLINTVPTLDKIDLSDYTLDFTKNLEYMKLLLYNNILKIYDIKNDDLLKMYENTLNEVIEDAVRRVDKGTNKIVTEFRYRIKYYNFITGLKTQIQVYQDIQRNYSLLKPMGECEAANSTETFNYREINPEFIKSNEMWKIISDNPELETPETIKKLTKKLNDCLPTFKSTMEIMVCEEEYTLRQYCAILWLIKNGKNIKIEIPSSYQNKNAAAIPRNLSAIFKNMTDPKITNKWYSILLINSFASEYRKINTNRNESHFYKFDLDCYSITYNIVKKHCNHLPSSQAMNAIAAAFNRLEKSLEEKIRLRCSNITSCTSSKKTPPKP